MTIDNIVQKEENIAKKVGKALYNGFYTALAGASTYLSYGFVGINGALTGIAFGAGRYIINKIKKIKTKYVDLVKEYIIGVMAGSVGAKLYETAGKYIPNIDLKGKIIRGLAGIGIANPIFTAAYVGSDHIIKNDFNPKGIGDKFKSNYGPILRDITKWLGIPVGLTINGYLGGYPGIVAMDTGYRVIAKYAKKKVKLVV